MESINTADISMMRFFIDSSGEKPFPGGIFDAYSLAKLTFGRSEEYLKLLRDNTKIQEGNRLKNIDQTTFNELIEYGNSHNNLLMDMTK